MVASLLQVDKAREPEWSTFISREGGFAVRLPGTPETKSYQIDSSNGKLDVWSVTANGGGVTYAIHYHDNPVVLPASQRNGYFKDHRDGLVRTHKGALRSEKTITVDGKPGRELVVDTTYEGAGATVLRVRFVLSGRRLYEVMAMAREKVADVPEIDDFLKSFTLKLPAPSATPPASGPDPDAKPEPFTSAEGGFSVAMPAAPEERTKSVEGQDLVQFDARRGEVRYVVSYTDHPNARDPKRMLDGTRDATVRSAKGKLISERPITLGRHSGRELTAVAGVGKNPKAITIRCRLYLVGKRVYQVLAIGPTAAVASDDVQKYLESFKLSAE